jgi:hypothetical protein
MTGHSLNIFQWLILPIVNSLYSLILTVTGLGG